MGYNNEIRPISAANELAWVVSQIREERQSLADPQIFEDELARLQVIIDRHYAAMVHAQAIYDRVETLRNISFDTIQHNNQSWRDLVSEFKFGEVYGGSTPAWAESAAPGPDGEYTHIRRGKDSLPGAPDGRRDSKG